MNKNTVFFLAAGKGSRMNSTTPKSLHLVNGEPNIVRNINIVTKLGLNYKLVIDKTDSIERYTSVGIIESNILKINSGFGSGHALLNIPIKDDDLVIWGDAVIIEEEIISELIRYSNPSPLIVPLKYVNNPYVTFALDNKDNSKITEVKFSKYGEHSSVGYQDCCVFKVKGGLLNHLRTIHNVIWKNRYITESAEFEFLYIIHYLYNIDSSAVGYMTEYPDSVLSYNNKEELEHINYRIRLNDWSEINSLVSVNV